MIILGIDPGTMTGLAAWDARERKLLKVESWTILEAMQQVLIWRDVADLALVIFEDARMIRIGGGNTFGQAERLQGVGSVKRDCAIWEEFLTRQGIPFEPRRARNTKLDAGPFEELTKWTERTNSHARDAAMIVFGLNAPIVRAKLSVLEDDRRAAAKGPALPDRRRKGNGRRRSYPAG